MKQRGFLGLGLAQLIMYGVIAAAVLGFIWGVVAWLEGRGYDKGVAEWQPKYTLAVAERESWKASSEGCSASIVAEKEKADARDAGARKEIAAQKARADANRKAMREAEKRAAEPPPGATCESAVIDVAGKL